MEHLHLPRKFPPVSAESGPCLGVFVCSDCHDKAPSTRYLEQQFGKLDPRARCQRGRFLPLGLRMTNFSLYLHRGLRISPLPPASGYPSRLHPRKGRALSSRAVAFCRSVFVSFNPTYSRFTKTAHCGTKSKWTFQFRALPLRTNILISLGLPFL